ncbi:nucleotide-diphospho-sugar transferase [Sistotremastrum niveocremeum HHB9708]|uniref:UDP-N-acetylglucosamine diphosphorylase n=1 Tax=Sistotremastrum niveocremeum HHB9708 TaxID=1314777 RepID=A0A164USQ9_9AGAM|nr:nucleotide-diphospho-sugar transferase [Sistotremastrum niveocremeum HHB9708]
MSETLRQKYEAAGQGHVFNFWSQLSEDDQKSLVSQLGSIDIERVNRVYSNAIQSEKHAAESNQSIHQGIEPLPEESFETILGAPQKEAQWREIGLEAIADGKVGVLLMAGGQGTRLGSSAPKGCYDIGLPSHKPLFQIQAERIARIQQVAAQAKGKSPASVVVPWYIMTSGPTRANTEAFFEEHAYFGLERNNVVFFEQGTLPCLSMDGKVLLEAPSRVAVAPDGNGGLYNALRTPFHLPSSNSSTTVLSDMESRGIQYVHAYGVDNCLVKVADPVFVGCCLQKQAECGSKVVRKTIPSESVGVVAVRDGRYSVVEYSEISKEQAELRDPKTGELAFRAANIVNHFYTTKFLKAIESFEDKMAFHIARKKIPFVDLKTGEYSKPSKPNGMKLELFVFDVFPFTHDFTVMEVERTEEFSPLKNAPGTGSDDPQTSRRDILAQQRRYLEQAGATVADGVEVEISPLVSYAGEGLESLRGKHFDKPTVLDKLSSANA